MVAEGDRVPLRAEEAPVAVAREARVVAAREAQAVAVAAGVRVAREAALPRITLAIEACLSELEIYRARRFTIRFTA